MNPGAARNPALIKVDRTYLDLSLFQQSPCYIPIYAAGRPSAVPAWWPTDITSNTSKQSFHSHRLNAIDIKPVRQALQRRTRATSRDDIGPAASSCNSSCFFRTAKHTPRAWAVLVKPTTQGKDAGQAVREELIRCRPLPEISTRALDARS